MELKEQILAACDNRQLLKEEIYADAVRAVIEQVIKDCCVRHRLKKAVDGRLTNG
ncbi:MAG: hypothetical protein R2765_04230 [Ferruginibacter sp.]